MEIKEVPSKPLVNKIANSGLEVIKLESFATEMEIVEFDLAEHLFRGLLLKEKDFRQALKEYDWASLEGKQLCVFCSTDAIVAKWAYMLIVQYAHPFAAEIFQGSKTTFIEKRLNEQIGSFDWSKYRDKRVILKGCSDDLEIPASTYMAATNALLPFAKSIMYGEPCSTVPVFKRKK